MLHSKSVKRGACVLLTPSLGKTPPPRSPERRVEGSKLPILLQTEEVRFPGDEVVKERDSEDLPGLPEFPGDSAVILGRSGVPESMRGAPLEGLPSRQNHSAMQGPEVAVLQPDSSLQDALEDATLKLILGP
jgi:hypothetical protein